MKNSNHIIICFMIPALLIALSVTCTAADKGEEFITKNSIDPELRITGDFSADNFLRILARLGIAALLGCSVACHPMRFAGGGDVLGKKTVRTIKSQILICVAGALMVIIISGSVARAFGLVGLGSFVRFRTTVKNQKELATMFLLVAVGMACGLGLYPVAVVGTAFIIVLITLLEIRKDSLTGVVVYSIETPDPVKVEPIARKIIEDNGAKIVKTKIGIKKGKVKFTLEKSEKISMSDLNVKLMEKDEFKSTALSWEENPGTVEED